MRPRPNHPYRRQSQYLDNDIFEIKELPNNDETSFVVIIQPTNIVDPTGPRGVEDDDINL